MLNTTANTAPSSTAPTVALRTCSYNATAASYS